MTTKIEWTDETWNPVRGCSRVSAGCMNCYAEKVAARFSDAGQAYEGLAKRSPARWTGIVRLIEDHLDIPLKWKRPRRIFVNSMSDLFHPSVETDWITRIFNVMNDAPQHTFQVLTKRPERMLDYCTRRARGMRVAPNVHLGVSVENQETADERIPPLLMTPAAVRWISAEPLLGLIDLEVALPCRYCKGRGWYLERFSDNHGTPCRHCIQLARTHGAYVQQGQFVKRGDSYIRWVVVGGESGHGARPMDIAWARSIVSQCQAANVPVFVKQMGAKVLGRNCEHGREGKACSFLDRKGGDWLEWPEDLRVREFPISQAEGIHA